MSPNLLITKSSSSHFLLLLLTTLILTNLLSMTSANPLPLPTTSLNSPPADTLATSLTSALILSPRATNGVYICSLPNYTGKCQWFSLTRTSGNVCNPIPYASSEYISFGPDKDATCATFTTEGCMKNEEETTWKEWAWPGEDMIPGPGYEGSGGGRGGGYKWWSCHVR